MFDYSTNLNIISESHSDYFSPENPNQENFVKTISYTYHEEEEYTKNYFNLIKSTDLFDSDVPIESTIYEYDGTRLLSANPSGTGYLPKKTSIRGLLTKKSKVLFPLQFDKYKYSVEEYTYDQTGNLRIVNEDGLKTQEFIYDDRTKYSLPNSIIFGSENLISYIYDINTSLPIWTKDLNGNISAIQYTPNATNWRANLITTSDGLKKTIKYNDKFMSIDQKITDTEGNEKYVTSRYDGRGLLRETKKRRFTDGGHDIVEYQYDNMGRKIKQSIPNRTTENTPVNWINFAYDNAGRLSSTIAPNGSIKRWFYNENWLPPNIASENRGPSIKILDPWGRTTWSMMDSLGYVRYLVHSNAETGEFSDIAGQLVEYSYDPRGLFRQILFNGQLRRFKYDSLGRLIGSRVPERDLTLDIKGHYNPAQGEYSDVYLYDDNSNLITHIDPRGVRTNYDYSNDPLRRLKSVSYDLSQVGDASSAITPVPSLTYYYSKTGDRKKIIAIANNNYQENFTYTPQGILESKLALFGEVDDLWLLTKIAYDSFGRRTKLIYPGRFENGSDLDTNQLNYFYSKDGELIRVDLDGKNIIESISYISNGVNQLIFNNNGKRLSENYYYDLISGRLNKLSIYNLENNENLLGFNYTYNYQGDNAETGQITSITRNLGSVNFGRQNQYYDFWGRLVSTYSENPFGLSRMIYSYDDFGNRKTVQNQIWWSGPPGQWVNASGSDGVNTINNTRNRIENSNFKYDNAGNIIQSDGPDGRLQKYFYDAAGRLSAVKDEKNNIIEAYRYGFDGRRTGVTNDGINWRLSIWDGNQELARYDYIKNKNELNWVDRTIYLGDRILSEIYRTQNGSALKMFHSDHRDSVMISEMVSGELQFKQYSSLPFGTSQMPVDDVRIFTNYRRSERTGLDYAINRYYDPNLGRFIQPDPLGIYSFDLSNSQSFNAYSYARNDPINRTDPSGLLDSAALPDCESYSNVGWCSAGGDVVYVGEAIEVTAPSDDSSSFNFSDAGSPEFGIGSTSQGQSPGETGGSGGGGGGNAEGVNNPEENKPKDIKPTCDKACQLAKAMFNPKNCGRATTQLDMVAMGMLAAPVAVAGGAVVYATGSIAAAEHYFGIRAFDILTRFPYIRAIGLGAMPGMNRAMGGDPRFGGSGGGSIDTLRGMGLSSSEIKLFQLTNLSRATLLANPHLIRGLGLNSDC